MGGVRCHVPLVRTISHICFPRKILMIWDHSDLVFIYWSYTVSTSLRILLAAEGAEV